MHSTEVLHVYGSRVDVALATELPGTFEAVLGSNVAWVPAPLNRIYNPHTAPSGDMHVSLEAFKLHS